MIDLVVDRQALIEPRRQIDAITGQLVKDKVRQFVWHVSHQCMVRGADRDNRSFIQHWERHTSYPFIGARCERAMKIVDGFVDPQVDLIDHPPTNHYAAIFYPVASLPQHYP